MTVEPDLPEHIEQSVAAIASLYDDHDRRASPLQKVAGLLVRLASRPQFAAGLAFMIAAWIAINLFSGPRANDPPPFALLQDAIGVLALFLTILILIAQRREYEFEERRAKLTLHLALLAEQKNAKIIEMLERLLGAHPDLNEHSDPAASEMSKPADSAAILSAIERK